MTQPDAEVPRAFRQSVERLRRELEAHLGHALGHEEDVPFAQACVHCLEIYHSLRTANEAPCGGLRPVFRLIDFVLRSRTWLPLLRWHDENLETITATRVGVRAVEAAWNAGGSGSVNTSRAGWLPQRTVITATLGIQGSALRLLTACLCQAAAAVQGEDASARRGQGQPAPPPPPPGLVDRMARSLRALLASHSLRRYARLTAQAADAAAAASGAVNPQQPQPDEPPVSSAQVLEDLLSSLSSLVESAAGFLRQPGMAARMASAGGSSSTRPTGATAAAGAAGATAGASAAARRSAARAAGRSAAAGGSRAAAAQLPSHQPPPPPPLNVLLLSELAASGFYDQLARLVVHTAAADGRWWLQQQQLRQASSRGGGAGFAAVALVLPAVTGRTEATRELADGLCTLLEQSGLLWVDCVNVLEAGGGSSSSSGSAAAAAAASRRQQRLHQQHQQQPPPPAPWGVCLEFMVLSLASASLAAAGFGGGAGGVWGLPPELAAGMPILVLPASSAVGVRLGGPGFLLEHLCHSGGGGGVRFTHLSSWPFRILIHTLCVTQRAARVRSRSAAATPAATGPVPVAVGEEASCWRFPVSPRAAQEVLVAVVELAAASMDESGLTPRRSAGRSSRSGSSTCGGSSGSSRGGSSGSHQAAAAGFSGLGSLGLKLTYSDGWEVGLDAVTAIKLVCDTQQARGQRKHPSAAERGPVAAVTRSAAAAPSGGGAGGPGGRAHGGPGMDTGGGGDVSGGGYPLLPVKFWRAAAAMLRRCAVLPTASSGASRLSWDRQLLLVMGWTRQIFMLEVMPGFELPPRPPRALRAALAGGVVPALEAAVRAAPDADMALELAAAFFNIPEDIFYPGACWPHLQQLLAFAPAAQTAALVTSLGKRLQGAVAQLASGGSSSISSSTAERKRRLWALVIGVLPADVEALSSLQSGSRTISTSSGSGIRAGSGESTGGPELLLQRQMRLLLSHAAHRWLPALSRCLRLPALQTPPTSHMTPLMVALQWLLRPLAEVATLDGQASQVDDALSDSASGACAWAAPANPDARAAAAAAAAAADSWRQWLLQEVEVVALVEAGLRTLAAMSQGCWTGAAAGLALVMNGTLTLLALAVPDALAPALRLPQPRGSPWHPDELQRVLLLHPVGYAPIGNGTEIKLAPLQGLEKLRGKAAALGQTDLWRLRREGAAMRPAAVRAALARLQAEGCFPEPPEPLLSPHGLAVEAAAVAAEAAAVAAEAAAASSGGGGGGAGGGGGGGAPQQREQQAGLQQLRWCGNPHCATLAGEGEAGLPLSLCTRCRCVRYCSRGCQAAHWRGGGHKEACPALTAAAAGAVAGAVTAPAAAAGQT